MDLPTPDPDAQAISRQLRALIADEIQRSNGSIGFDRYMELCLYAPGLGYYMTGSRKLGAAGDFITAPEMSPLFSRCLAGQCAEAFGALAGRQMLEFGAGCGWMAADILKQLQQLQALPEHYLILEISPDLRERQQQTLSQLPRDLAKRVQWLDTLPNSFIGVVLANEVLDAMPTPRFVIEGECCKELAVQIKNEHVDWLSQTAPKPIQTAFAEMKRQGLSFDDGYISELHPRQSAWLNSLADHLDQAVVLLIDYGHTQSAYYHPERRDGTLRCHYHQRAHNNPFFWPGLQDLTVHINFSALAQTTQKEGMNLLGFTTQGNFLLNAGITQMAENDASTHPIDLAQQIKQLTLPSGMGEQFKVMGLGKNCEPQLSGFRHRDLRHQL